MDDTAKYNAIVDFLLTNRDDATLGDAYGTLLMLQEALAAHDNVTPEAKARCAGIVCAVAARLDYELPTTTHDVLMLLSGVLARISVINAAQL